MTFLRAQILQFQVLKYLDKYNVQCKYILEGDMFSN